MLDVRVRRRVRVDVHVHRARALVDRRARAGVPREHERLTRGRGAARAVLRLDGEEPARVVLEVVDAEDDDVTPRRHLGARFGERGLPGGLLGLHVRLPVLGALTPRRGTLDGRAELVARSFECIELVLVAEDGDGDGPVRVRAQVVVVEVDAVLVGVELQLDRRGLVGQIDLDEAATLIRVYPPLVLLCCGTARGRKSDQHGGEHR